MADGMVESADDFKAAGNAAFKAGNFDEAIKQFTSAIELGKKNEHPVHFRKLCLCDRGIDYFCDRKIRISFF